LVISIVKYGNVDITHVLIIQVFYKSLSNHVTMSAIFDIIYNLNHRFF